MWVLTLLPTTDGVLHIKIITTYFVSISFPHVSVVITVKSHGNLPQILHTACDWIQLGLFLSDCVLKGLC